mmetsp:Transcript_2657/g.8624  ORF Transcript_2657/g.8624 Transcript_2657/m.8624 type:complete len:240 (+) Transcript_2657:251-970(+)
MRGSPITSRAPGDVARRRRPARATVRAGRDESIANNQSIVQKSSDGLRATRAREASVARVGRAPRGDAWRRVRSHTSRAGASARRRVARAPALDAPVRDARRRARLWIARDVRDWRARARRDRGRERPAWLRTRRRASPHARCADPIARRARARGRAVCAALRALYVPLCVSVCVCVRVPHSGCRAWWTRARAPGPDRRATVARSSRATVARPSPCDDVSSRRVRDEGARARVRVTRRA